MSDFLTHVDYTDIKYLFYYMEESVSLGIEV